MTPTTPPAPLLPTSAPVPSPTPEPTPTPTPTPAVSDAPLEKILGDWQSTFNDPNYFGNVTYSIKADGHIRMSLLIYGKGKSQIMAERHEFQGAFFNSQRKIQLEYIKGNCAPKNVQTTLSFSFNDNDPDTLFLLEGSIGSYLRLSKLKGGLTQDVHSVTALGKHSVEDGCFLEGRLKQFVPTQGRGA